MTTQEKFNKAIDYLMYQNVTFANQAIKEVAAKSFSTDEWNSLSDKQKSAFRVSVIGQLAIEMAFAK